MTTPPYEGGLSSYRLFDVLTCGGTWGGVVICAILFGATATGVTADAGFSPVGLVGGAIFVPSTIGITSSLCDIAYTITATY